MDLLTDNLEITKERLVPQYCTSLDSASRPYVEVPLTRGLVALIDAEDAERILSRKWFAATTTTTNGRPKFYAHSYRKGAGGVDILHRIILEPAKDERVDHINGDGLDCRRANLRVATRRQNNLSRPQAITNSGLRPYKGVVANVKGFYALISVDGVGIRSVVFDTAEDAACAYDRLAEEIGGEFAWKNLPEHRLDLPLLDIVYPGYWERLLRAVAIYREEAA